MTRIYYAALEAAMAVIILVPLFLILYKVRFHSTKFTVVCLGFCVYLSGVYALVGLPNMVYFRFDPNLHLIPFAGMAADITAVALNILLFLPFGFLLPILWPVFRSLKNSLLCGLGYSLAIELLQMFSSRATDINDLITNTLGTLIGYCIGKVIIALAPSLKCKGRKTDFLIMIGVSFGVMFVFQPVIWKLIY